MLNHPDDLPEIVIGGPAERAVYQITQETERLKIKTVMRAQKIYDIQVATLKRRQNG